MNVAPSLTALDAAWAEGVLREGAYHGPTVTGPKAGRSRSPAQQRPWPCARNIEDVAAFAALYGQRLPTCVPTSSRVVFAQDRAESRTAARTPVQGMHDGARA